MGLLRLLLSLEVVLIHSGAGSIFGGRVVVQLFYLFSGYVIALVLSDRDRYDGAISFYFARAIRLYPEYLLVAAITLPIVAFLPVPEHRPLLEVITGPLGPAVAISNITVIGQDWLMFIPGAHHGLLMPQTWALGIEASFYVLAPFALRSKRRIAILLLMSICIRVALFVAGIGFQDPWTHRFFPAELAIFLLGAIVQRSIPAPLLPGTMLAITLGCCALLVGASLFRLPEPVRSILIIGSFALAMPAIAKFDTVSAWSRTLGNLSYPLYLTHIAALAVVEMLASKAHAPAIGVVASVAVAIVFFWFATPRLDAFRLRARQWERARRLHSVGRHQLAEDTRQALSRNVVDFGDPGRDRSDEPLRDVA
ncbi:acyltransferase family protein [Sphingomonas sp. OTU376]|uniref:acyltransferase family protein n=1 Tax=Sphingomonas sp. OTU376 TaxID=3043863 RepID=UPI00313C73B8